MRRSHGGCDEVDHIEGFVGTSKRERGVASDWGFYHAYFNK